MQVQEGRTVLAVGLALLEEEGGVAERAAALRAAEALGVPLLAERVQAVLQRVSYTRLYSLRSRCDKSERR